MTRNRPSDTRLALAVALLFATGWLGTFAAAHVLGLS